MKNDEEYRDLLILTILSVILYLIVLFCVSQVPGDWEGLLNRDKTEVATSTVATATDADAEAENKTFFDRYGLVRIPVETEAMVYIPSPVFSERKEPSLEFEIVTTEEITTEAVTTEAYVEEPEVVEVSEPEGMTYIGTYYCTGYVATGNPCANGNYPTVGYTIASNSLPMGTTVYIEGLGTRVVEDTGAMPASVIDIFVGSVDEAYAITGSYEVYVYE